MKLTEFEKFAIQMIKDIWRIMVIAAVILLVFFWSLFKLVEMYLGR